MGGASRDRVSLRRVRPEVWAWAALVAVAVAVAAVGIPLNALVYGIPVVLAFPLTALHAAAAVGAVFRPRTAAVGSLVLVLALAALSSGESSAAPWPVAVTTLLGQCALLLVFGLRAPWRIGVACWVGGMLVGCLGLLGPWPTTGAAVTADLVVFSSVTGAALLIGVLVGRWRRISAQLVRERRLTEQEHAARVVVQEKTRIARELHDVIAHSMSIVNVQATTARYRHPGADAELLAEFDELAASSRQALREMRGVLSVLREAGSDADTAPQPGFAEIPELVETTRRAGTAVDVVGAEVLAPGAGDEVAGTVTYRLLQEALSNATRHAPGARAEVRFERPGPELVLTVRNGPPERPPDPVAGGGHGQAGMRERVAIVGGGIEFGSTEDGGYRVVATVPLGSGERQEVR
ncbi:sensor histidine kinase [Saccharopolyspora sp. CA-218241]|uniref:sensor histidine kinase n=1 Tax=Saccharopolyspora sp. CA-218241 TaxID=3240027 RepID=UPI003D9782D8